MIIVWLHIFIDDLFTSTIHHHHHHFHIINSSHFSLTTGINGGIFLLSRFNIAIIISISLTFHYSHTINSIQYQFLTKDKTCFNLLLIKKRAVDAQINLRSRYLFWLNIIRLLFLSIDCLLWCCISVDCKSFMYMGWKVNMVLTHTVVLLGEWGCHLQIY